MRREASAMAGAAVGAVLGLGLPPPKGPRPVVAPPEGPCPARAPQEGLAPDQHAPAPPEGLAPASSRRSDRWWHRRELGHEGFGCWNRGREEWRGQRRRLRGG